MMSGGFGSQISMLSFRAKVRPQEGPPQVVSLPLNTPPHPCLAFPLPSWLESSPFWSLS